MAVRLLDGTHDVEFVSMRLARRRPVASTYHLAIIVFRGLLEACTHSSMAPFSRAGHPVGMGATAIRNLPARRG